MKKIVIEISDNAFERINRVVEFQNLKNIINKEGMINIDDFIKGAIAREIEKIETYNDIFCELKMRGLLKPLNLKNNFKKVLSNLNLKQLDLSELTGIDTSDLSMYLNNRRPMSLEIFLRIWIVLGCPPIHEVLFVE